MVVFRVPVAASDIKVPSEPDVEGIILWEPVQTVEDFLIPLEHNNSHPTTAGVLMLLGEVPGFGYLELSFHFVERTQPVHQFAGLKSREDSPKIHR